MKSDLDAVIEHHKIIDCDAVCIGMAPPENRYFLEGVESFLKSINDIAAKLKDAGLTLYYHNHAFEFYRLNNYKYNMMDILLENTDPKLVNFVFDVAWSDYAEQDPTEVMRKKKGIIKVIHFKDYTFDCDGHLRFVSLGKGTVDLRACYETASMILLNRIILEEFRIEPKKIKSIPGGKFFEMSAGGWLLCVSVECGKKILYIFPNIIWVNFV